MTSTNQQIKRVALSLLGDMPADQIDRDKIAVGLRSDTDKLLENIADARWRGDTDKINGIKYQLMVKRTMIKILSRNGVR